MESHREQQIRQALAAALVFKVLSFKRSLKQVLKGVNPMSIVLAALAALMYGCGDFAGGTASRKNPLLSVVLFSQIIGVAAALAVIPFLGVKSPAPSDLVFGSLSGIFGTLGLLALYEGIAKTPVAVVSPFSAVIGALLPMAFGLISGENPSPVMWIGSAVCIPAVILLSWEKSGAVGSGEIKKGLLYGMIAGAGFGGFFIAISRTAPEAGLWPLVAARSTSIFFVLIFSLVRRNLAKPERSSLWIIIFAGLWIWELTLLSCLQPTAC